jgi:hypothetical protein
MMKKVILPALLVAAVASTPAMADSFGYGLGNASVKTGGVSYSGITYNLGAKVAMSDDIALVVDYASGKLKKTGQTNVDYAASYVGIQYAAFDMGSAVLSVNLGSANVSTKQGATKVATSVTESGARFGIGLTTSLSDTASLQVNIDRDTSADITVTALDLTFEVGENMDLTIQAANATDYSAYSVGLSHGF